MKTYSVYILRCNDESYYTGVTNDIELRLEEHHHGVDNKCYTYPRHPVQLVFYEEFGDINDAIGREKQIKKWSRAKKEALFRGIMMGWFG